VTGKSQIKSGIKHLKSNLIAKTRQLDKSGIQHLKITADLKSFKANSQSFHQAHSVQCILTTGICDHYYYEHQRWVQECVGNGPDGSVSVTGRPCTQRLAGRGRHTQPACCQPQAQCRLAYLLLQPTGNETDGSRGEAPSRSIITVNIREWFYIMWFSVTHYERYTAFNTIGSITALTVLACGWSRLATIMAKSWAITVIHDSNAHDTLAGNSRE